MSIGFICMNTEIYECTTKNLSHFGNCSMTNCFEFATLCSRDFCGGEGVVAD